jgi:D-galacturonate reductase
VHVAGKFSGQLGYGYRSFELFVDAAMAVNSGECSPEEFDNELATVATTLRTTAILEAGRRSLDNVGRSVEILYEYAADPCRPTNLRLVSY